MRNLPNGTLTFFFSDIEGSTRLLEGLGDRYSPVLERHRAIVRVEFAARGGVEVNTQGDSFFAVFPEAHEAIVAAVGDPARHGRRAVAGRDDAADPDRAAHGRGARRRRRLRRSRRPPRRAGSWRPRTAARSSRRRRRARTPATSSTASIQLRDLGEHRLRDLSAPERLYQVIADGLDGRVPAAPDARPDAQQPADAADGPHRTRRRARADRPPPRFVARSDPDAHGARRHRQDAPGAPGRRQPGRPRRATACTSWTSPTSKTRAGALREIARALGIGLRAGADLHAALAEQIGDRDLLLVLDNFEQVMSAADDVADLLRLCPRSARHRHEPRIPARPRRAADRGRAALVPGRPARSPVGRRPRELRGGPPLRRARQRGAERLHADRRERARRGRHLRPARRPAARDRAGRGAAAAVLGRGAPRSAAERPRRAARRCAGPAAAPAHAAEHDRVELRPARRRRARGLPAAVRVRLGADRRGRTGRVAAGLARRCRRRRRPRVARRQEPHPRRGERARSAPLDARDDPRVRGRAARAAIRPGRTQVRDAHAAYFTEFAQAKAADLSGPARTATLRRAGRRARQPARSHGTGSSSAPISAGCTSCSTSCGRSTRPAAGTTACSRC